MKIDMAKMKAAFNRLNGKGGSGVWYKATDGDQIRILPTDDGVPLKEYFFHYNVGDKGFLCPKRNYHQDCPVCDFVSELFNSGEEDEKEFAKNIMAKPRYHSIVAVRGKEGDGPKIWAYSPTVFKSIFGLMLDEEDFGDITAVESGNDLKVSVGKQKGQKYAMATVSPKPTKTPLSKSTSGSLKDDVIDVLLREQPVVLDYLDKLTSEEVGLRLKQLVGKEKETQVEVNTAKSGSIDEKKKEIDEFLNQ